MRRCPKCGEFVREGDLHHCAETTQGVMLKIDVLRAWRLLKEWKKRKWKI